MPRRALIYRDLHPDPDYPWYYTVEREPREWTSLDYGSVPSWREAMEAVEYALTHEEEFLR